MSLGFLLPKGPEPARLLDDEERDWIIQRRARGLEQAQREHPSFVSLPYHCDDHHAFACFTSKHAG